jgi:flagellin
VDTGDFNGDGIIDLVTTDSSSNTYSVLIGDGSGNFLPRVSFGTENNPGSLVTGDFNNDGVLDLVSANSASSSLSVLLGSATTGTAPILDFSLQTMADARQALPLLKQKLNHLTSQRGAIGAFESRLSTAKNVLQSTVENYSIAASQITDVDVAEESARLVRTQILQQSAAAVLAQANQQPALALQLLRVI